MRRSSSPLFLARRRWRRRVPIVLHLLKREPEARVRFAAVQAAAARAGRAHADRRHLRELLLLALRVAALVLLALAFARPFFAVGARRRQPRGVTVVALDTSFSMSAPGRSSNARSSWRRTAIGRRRPATGRRRHLRRRRRVVAAAVGAIARWRVGDRRRDAGLRRARATAPRCTPPSEPLDGRAGRIVVVTDLQESGWDAGDRAAVPEATRIEVADVGAPPPNLAVTARASGGRRDRRDGSQAGRRRARRARASSTIDGRPAGERRGARVGPPTRPPRSTFAGARARHVGDRSPVDDRDGIAADNVRYVVLEAASRPRCWSSPPPAISAATRSTCSRRWRPPAATATAYQVAGVGARRSCPRGIAARLDRHAAVVLLSTRGLERRGRELLAAYVQSGGGVLIAAGPDVDGEVVGDVLGGSTLSHRHRRRPSARDGGPASLAPADVRHPVFRRSRATPRRSAS